MKPHRFDPLSFTFGLIFVVAAGILPLGLELGASRLKWIAAAVLLFLGVLMITTSRTGPRD